MVLGTLVYMLLKHHILRGTGREFVPVDPLLDCQQGQFEILGALLRQGAVDATLSHLRSELVADKL